MGAAAMWQVPLRWDRGAASCLFPEVPGRLGQPRADRLLWSAGGSCQASPGIWMLLMK